MLNLLNIDKPIRVNGVEYKNSASALEALKNFTGEFKIEINFKPQQSTEGTETSRTQVDKPNTPSAPQDSVDNALYKITVRAYMTKKSTPEFDLMKKINNDVPMPFRTMFGTILEETKGMYKMKLHARPFPTSECMHCGKTLTHPVSLLYGIGPICGKHAHINPFDTEEELNANYEALRKALAEVTWEGWVVKKAITHMEVVE